MMHTEEQLATSVLQFYRRAFWVALAITIMLAATLTLHLYNLRLQQAFTQFQTHYERLNSQLDKTLTGVGSIFQAVNISLEQPINYEFSRRQYPPVQRQPAYFYQSIGVNTGELVGHGHLQNIDLSHPYWLRVMALGGVFNTSLALLEPLEAMAFVSESGLAFVQRRNKNNSELLSHIVAGRFFEKSDLSGLKTSQRIEIDGKHYFAMSNKRISSSQDHTLMIFDAERFQQLFYDKSMAEADILLADKLHRNLTSTTEISPPSDPLKEQFSPWHNGFVFYHNERDRPLDIVMKVSEREFSKTIIYGLGLEFSFILLFILVTYFPLHWLCEQIFVRPLKELFQFIKNPEERQSDYVVPKLWLAEFKQVKAIHQHRAQLFKRVKSDHETLSSQLLQKQQHLELAGQDKERQSAVLKGVLDAVPDAIYYCNNEGNLLGCNRAFERLMAQNKQKFLGKSLKEIAEDLGDLENIEAKVREQHKPISHQLNHDSRTYYITITPFFSEQLGVMGCVGVLRDITEHQQAIELLKISESNFKSAIEYAPNGVVLVKIDGTVMMLNLAAQCYLNCEDIESKKHISELFNHSNYQQITQIFEHLTKQKQSVDQVNLTQLGDYRFLDLKVSLVCDSEQMPKYFVIHIQDITEITQARLEAERATLAKSRFIANLSHEIRTPLNVILGLVDMVQRSTIDKSQLTRLETVTHAAHTLLEMLNDILDFAKVESHEMRVKYEDVMISELCEDLKELIEPLAKQKGLITSYTIDEAVCSVLLGDKQKLKQILLNLLNNAVKYTAQGNVSFHLSVDSQSAEAQVVRFSVKDTGVGIKQSDQLKLFDAFTQVDDSLAREHEGIGLGLAIVKHEVELLGGKIALNSEFGNGSEFYFSLALLKKPLIEKNELGKVQNTNFVTPDNTGSTSYQGALCLVVDDNELNLEITQNMLQQLGVNVVTLQTAKGICEVVDLLKPDIIFMDIHMPEIDGFEAARQLSESSTQIRVPIFALTANIEVVEQQEYLHSSMHGYINKPVSIEVLEEVLIQHINPHKQFFDETFALKQMMGEPAFLEKMLQKYSELCEQYVQQLNNELNVKELTLLAHNIKGVSAGLGFEQLADIANQLETHLKKENQIINSELKTQLIAHVLRVQAFLKARINGC